MSLPREIFIKNGRLYQTPVHELEEMRCNRVEYKDLTVEDVVTLKGVEGRKVDMEITLRPEDAQNIYQKFAVRFAQNEQFHTALSFRPQEEILKIDRKFSGSRRAIIHQRRSKVEGSQNGEIKLRVILDSCSAEIFINDGIQVMTATLYTDLAANGISFYADGKVKMDLVKYDLK
jgi:beta-fructofuranosidase